MSSPLSASQQQFLWPVLVALLTVLVSVFLFKVYLFHPNDYMFAFGGDALVIYYDMIYHVCHDKGTMLNAMNYPYGEYIFLTDAQGAISTVLQWINRHLFDVCDCIPGFVHTINIFLLPVCSVLIHYILRYFKVTNSVALPFAILITFLSPQMFRFGGHFGLAYPFIIPLVFLWFLRKFTYSKVEKRDLLVCFILIFFTFNNPYVGFGGAGFLICTGGLLALLSIRNHHYLKKAIIVGGVGIISILIPFITFLISDPVTDRMQQQWGFFFYHASIDGVLLPNHSFLHLIFRDLALRVKPTIIEHWANIGIVCVALLVWLLIYKVLKYFNKNNKPQERIFTTANLFMLGGALLMFLFAGSYYYEGFPEAWMEDHLGFMLMFKASARIGWSFYFALTITCIVFLDHLLKKINKPFLFYTLLLIPIVIWSFEIKEYIGRNYKECFHNNFFSKADKQSLLNTLSANNVDVTEYQAMYVLPKMMAWTDDFLSDILWSSQFYSMRISAATGLPMISAMLSRMSIGQTAEAIQMISHPLIRRDLPDKLPNQKDILVLLGGEHPPLKVGEQYLLDISHPVLISKDFSLYRLRIDDLRQNSYINDARKQYALPREANADIIHLSFDESETDVSFYGKGSKLVPTGETMIIDQKLPMDADTQYVFSAWTKVDHHKYGVGAWRIIVTDNTGKETFSHITETRRSNDIQDLWIRSEVVFSASKGSTIKASLLSNKNLYADEVIIQPVGATTIIDIPGSNSFMFNGYKIVKE